MLLAQHLPLVMAQGTMWVAYLQGYRAPMHQQSAHLQPLRKQLTLLHHPHLQQAQQSHQRPRQLPAPPLQQVLATLQLVACLRTQKATTPQLAASLLQLQQGQLCHHHQLLIVVQAQQAMAHLQVHRAAMQQGPALHLAHQPLLYHPHPHQVLATLQWGLPRACLHKQKAAMPQVAVLLA